MPVEQGAQAGHDLRRLGRRVRLLTDRQIVVADTDHAAGWAIEMAALKKRLIRREHAAIAIEHDHRRPQLIQQRSVRAGRCIDHLFTPLVPVGLRTRFHSTLIEASSSNVSLAWCQVR